MDVGKGSGEIVVVLNTIDDHGGTNTKKYNSKKYSTKIYLK